MTSERCRFAPKGLLMANNGIRRMSDDVPLYILKISGLNMAATAGDPSPSL